MRKIINQLKQGKRIEYILLSIIIITALFTRLYKIDNPIADWHSWRQADTASVSREYVMKGIDLLHPRYHDISTTQTRIFNPEGFRFVEFPIFNAIHAIFYLNFPFFTFEIWGRLISIFSALGATYFVYRLGKRYISATGGILAAFYYALIPFNIYFTRVILPEPLATLIVLASLWFFVKYIDENKSVYIYLSAILLGLGLLVKPFVAFYAVPMIYLAIKKFSLKGTLINKKMYLLLFLSVTPLLVWRMWMSQFPEGIPLWRWVFNGDGIRFKPSFWRWIFGERLGRLILGIGGLIPFSFAILAYKKNKSFIHAFLFGMFLYVTVFASANVKHDYYQTITIPAISLALAYGSIVMWNIKEFNKGISRSMLLFSVSLMFNVGYANVKEFYNINRPEIIEAGKAVDKLAPEDALVIAAYNGDTAFLYQTKRWGWPVVDRPIDELIEKGADYYVSVDLNHPQTKEFMIRFELVEKTDRYVVIKLN